MATIRSWPRTLWVSVRTMLILTLALGVLFPAAILGVGQLAFPGQANGSLLEVPGHAASVGSALLGQTFNDASGNPDPAYFQPRPSAAGDGYDGAASSGSNMGPENPKFLEAIDERKAAYLTENSGTTVVPADALTASASGLDPDISVANALEQAARVAKARSLDPAKVVELVHEQTIGRDLGFLGEPRVNVLKLNIALVGLDN
ncbi:K(+)-transporting ATPase subunit C [Paeniglutamicibacter kerguelensis]|uniref:Potassium-transporting ATPase KdpC subunit n=1 Tax=Paeniglutamicibacter kerguelensis TaxID=254788 RepID=A0ABS4XH19_9MICC|nr:K(+)-transporting ATPase subunit C [Paeniglutamicibacter kerguelensis]MBP2387548.1 K+-transporting ATPase ATPase C chain [Paeniglutamicibacter kerguelensis]